MPKAEITNVRNENENSLHRIPRLSTFVPRNVLKTGTIYIDLIEPKMIYIFLSLNWFWVSIWFTFICDKIEQRHLQQFWVVLFWFQTGSNQPKEKLTQICCDMHFSSLTICLQLSLPLCPVICLLFGLRPQVYTYFYICVYVWVCLNTIALIEQLECRFLSILYLTRCASDRCSCYLFVVNWYSSSKGKWFARQSARHTHTHGHIQQQLKRK